MQSSANAHPVSGFGLGLRKEIADYYLQLAEGSIDFVEFAPENWMGVGGTWAKYLRKISERFPLTCHGLSLSMGSPEELDWTFLKKVKTFFKTYSVKFYSEHLSFAKCDNAHLYDLLPLPFTVDAVKHVAQRIREVQDFLEFKIAIENVSYYLPLLPEMEEATFISEVVREADCHLLLDVNNVYVNSFNHDYDAHAFLKKLPLEKVRYLHIAGHEKAADDLIIDTHGQPIADPVYELFSWLDPLLPNDTPVLLERDFNFTRPDDLYSEIQKLRRLRTQTMNSKSEALSYAA